MRNRMISYWRKRMTYPPATLSNWYRPAGSVGLFGIVIALFTQEEGGRYMHTKSASKWRSVIGGKKAGCRPH